MICWEHATWPRQMPKGWQDIGWEQATWPTGAQRMAGYRLRAGHLPKRHARNTKGMDEDGRISAESMLIYRQTSCAEHRGYGRG